MNDDIAIDHFYEEMEKIAFSLGGGLKHVKNTLTQTAKAGKQQLMHSTEQGTFTAAKKLTGETQAAALNSLEDLGNLGGDALIQTSKKGVSGTTNKQQLLNSVNQKADEATMQRLQNAKKQYNLSDEQMKKIELRVRSGEKVSEQEMASLAKENYSKALNKSDPASVGTFKQYKADVDQMVSKSPTGDLSLNSAREEALASVKKDLGLGDQITIGKEFQEHMVLNPEAAKSLSMSQLLTYGGINALGFAGRNAEVIAKGGALTAGGLGLYSVLD